MFHSSEIRELPMLNENVSKFDIITYGKKEALTLHNDLTIGKNRFDFLCRVAPFGPI